MRITTTRFGEIEVGEDKVIHFPVGVPGFADLKRYVLIDYKDSIKWLHSIENPDVAFIVTDPFTLFPDYSFKIEDEVETFLGIANPTDVCILVILRADESGLVANLKAPIILNASNLKAAQILLDDERYSFRVPLPALPKEKERA